MLFERERKEAEDALRRRLALETEAALAQQEKDLAALIGRLEVQLTLVISKSKGPSKTLRDIRTPTYQIYSIEEKIFRTTTFPLVRNIY